MTRMSARIVGAVVALASIVAEVSAQAAGSEAHVTQIIREVNLVPNEAKPKPAAINDLVREDTAVRTGDKSKSELTFADLTITRLGANSIYTYNRAGRSVDLGGGSILLRVPKDSGGASVRGNAVTVAVTGTTFILESSKGGRTKLYLLEGSARASLRKVRAESRDVAGGQMLDVPAGATTLPMPVNFDVNDLMNKHPLIVGFPPLPSNDAIARTARNPSGPSGPIINVGGFGLPPILVGGGSGGGGGRNYPNPTTGRPPGTTDNPNNGGKGGSQTQHGEKSPPRKLPPKRGQQQPGVY